MDRRFLLAMALIMAILLGPGLFRDPPPTPAVPDSLETAGPVTGPESADSVAAPVASPTAPPVALTAQEPALAQDTVVVTSDLYRYAFSTQGGRLISAVLTAYHFTIQGQKDQSVQLLRDSSMFLAPRLLLGRDTLRLDEWVFTPSATELTVDEPTVLTLRGTGQGLGLELRYRFTPGTYHVDVTGTIEGLGPNGGQLLIGMGPGIANTEENRSENVRNMGFVTRNGGSNFTRFTSLDPGESVTEPGPFEWVALKSKYFVAAVLTVHEGAVPLSGVTAAVAPDAPDDPETADIWTSLPVTADGDFHFEAYTGPMEYERLRAIGHGFDDVNPYGWPGLRTIIRPVAVAARWVLVWMHETLNIHYGIVLILFGILIRVVLWPLNQKAMRASLRMQAVQPLMKELQDKYKDQPERLQKEMFKLYKEHNVNPLGGCWPMLLPFPVLIALFFVFQNTIELRGVSFLWLPDLAEPDPLYAIPILMGASMFFVSKVGQMGMEPNPQMKMMLYVMPVMMTVLFANFASGLNLYYTVQNIVSIPQQYWIAKERMRANPPKKPEAAAPAPVPAEPPGETSPRPRQKKRKKRR